MSNPFAEQLAPLAQRLGVPVPGPATATPAPSSATSLTALASVRNPLDQHQPQQQQQQEKPADAAVNGSTNAAGGVGAVDLSVPEMGADVMLDGGDDEQEFGDSVDANSFDPYFSGGVTDDVEGLDALVPDMDAFGLDTPEALATLDAAAHLGDPVSLAELSDQQEFGSQDAATGAGPFDADDDEDGADSPTLGALLAADAARQGIDVTAPDASDDGLVLPEPAPRQDPVQDTDFESEFISKDTVLTLASTLRERNDQSLRQVLMGILPQIFGAKTLTAENDVAIYIAENASFRDWLQSLFTKLGIKVQQSDRSIDLGDNRLFLSRAPSLFDFRNAMMHAVTEIDRLMSKAESLDAQANGFNQLQIKTSDLSIQLAETQRSLAQAQNEAARLRTESERVRPLPLFRLQWVAKGKRSDGTVATRPCFLVLNPPKEKDVDRKPDGTYPLKFYTHSHVEDEATVFATLATAESTFHLIRSQGHRIAAHTRNAFFAPNHLGSLELVQWAQVVVPVRARTASV